jgi:hypothetical protein
MKDLNNYRYFLIFWSGKNASKIYEGCVGRLPVLCLYESKPDPNPDPDMKLTTKPDPDPYQKKITSDPQHFLRPRNSQVARKMCQRSVTRRPGRLYGGDNDGRRARCWWDRTCCRPGRPGRGSSRASPRCVLETKYISAK